MINLSTSIKVLKYKTSSVYNLDINYDDILKT